MSADSQLITAQGSYSVCLSASLPDTQQHVIKELLDLLPTGHTGNIELDGTTGSAQPILNIKSWVDGRGLACPMPLLKTKVALRDVAAGESLYVVATDPNSKADITAFCQQSQQAKMTSSLGLTMSEMTDRVLVDGATSQRFDTIYHFIITKTDSN